MSSWLPLLLAILGWGASNVITRALLVSGVGTFTVLPARYTIGLLGLGIAMVATGSLAGRTPRTWRYGLLLGIVGMAAPTTLGTIALEDLPVTLGGLLIALIPAATVGAAHFLVPDERFEVRSLPGLLVAFAGVAVLLASGEDLVGEGGDFWRGVLWIVAGVVMAGIGGALTRRFSLVVPPAEMVLPQFVSGTAVLVAVLPLLGEAGFSTVSGYQWVLLVTLGLLGTTLPFTSFLLAARTNPASRLALTGYLVPVVAVGMAIVFLHEPMTLEVGAGAALILGGVVMADRANQHVPVPGPLTVE